MKEELIKFETANLAKKKGFDWVVPSSYLIYTEELSPTTTSYNNREDYNSAPTQSLLQKWLREEHNILVITDYDVNHKMYFYWMITDETRGIKRDFYSTYEKALEKGLQEALKLIK